MEENQLKEYNVIMFKEMWHVGDNATPQLDMFVITAKDIDDVKRQALEKYPNGRVADIKLKE